MFGVLMDRGLFRPVLIGVALLQGLAVVAALFVGKGAPGPGALPSPRPSP